MHLVATGRSISDNMNTEGEEQLDKKSRVTIERLLKQYKVARNDIHLRSNSDTLETLI